MIADSAALFESIFDDVVNVCIWNRAPDDMLARYLECTVDRGRWERVARVDTDCPELDGLLKGFEPGVGRVRLTTEIAGLIDLFATLSDARVVGVRMMATDGEMCPLFHVDQVGLRLLCTWTGAGTEWLDAADVVREGLGHHTDAARSKAGPMRPGATIQRMAPFAVGVFKGEAWPGNTGRGAVHRSPKPNGWRALISSRRALMGDSLNSCRARPHPLRANTRQGRILFCCDRHAICPRSSRSRKSIAGVVPAPS